MRIRRAIGRAWLSAFGWTADGVPPSEPRYVLIAAPHTTNWDLPFTLAVCWSHNVDMRWMGKHTLFRGPMGVFFRALGGVAVVRNKGRNTVQQMADRFAETDRLVMILATEGTRSKVPYWKSGFYHIAAAADVPIITGYLDYAEKRGGFGPPIHTTGDLVADMDQIRAYYTGISGKYPENFGLIRVKEEVSEEEMAEIKAAREARRARR